MSLSRTWAAVAILSMGGAVACGGATATVDKIDPHIEDAGADRVVPGDDDDQDGSVPDARPPRIPKKHRPAPLACSRTRAPGVSNPGGPTFDSGTPMCNSDADCTQGTNGRCTSSGGRGFRTCSYDECFADSDCGEGYACACGDVQPDGQRYAPNECVRGNCMRDSDCGAGNFCSPSIDMNGCTTGPGGFYCHTPSDGCLDDTDCKDFEKCNYDPAGGRWTCMPQVVCAG